MSRRPDRRRAEAKGRRAEWLAAWRLRLAGYRILARDFKTVVGEIDLIARRGRRLVFVEVKARGNLDLARAAIMPNQRQRIERAAAAFLAARPELAALEPCFAAVLVSPGRLPRLIVDAWRVSD
ncbi:MAG: YraN family protein [Proteobacteria bacterium]|nr:YraN family protein [Pseudomonadota bacterium]